jgi:hypothetical protein
MHKLANGQLHTLLVTHACTHAILTWCLKARTVEPEDTAVATEHLSKHTSMATNRHNIEELLEAVFSMWPVLRLYTGDRT